MIDLFASEYGWTVPDVLDLTTEEINLMQKGIESRFKRQEQAQKEYSKGKGKHGREPNFSSPKKKLENVLSKYKANVVEE